MFLFQVTELTQCTLEMITPKNKLQEEKNKYPVDTIYFFSRRSIQHIQKDGHNSAKLSIQSARAICRFYICYKNMVERVRFSHYLSREIT